MPMDIKKATARLTSGVSESFRAANASSETDAPAALQSPKNNEHASKYQSDDDTFPRALFEALEPLARKQSPEDNTGSSSYYDRC